MGTGDDHVVVRVHAITFNMANTPPDKLPESFWGPPGGADV